MTTKKKPFKSRPSSKMHENTQNPLKILRTGMGYISVPFGLKLRRNVVYVYGPHFTVLFRRGPLEKVSFWDCATHGLSCIPSEFREKPEKWPLTDRFCEWLKDCSGYLKRLKKTVRNSLWDIQCILSLPFTMSLVENLNLSSLTPLQYVDNVKKIHFFIAKFTFFCLFFSTGKSISCI